MGEKLPIVLLPDGLESHCGYCDELVTREEFLSNHTLKKCQPEEEIDGG